jgi:tubulin-specific chaperone A
MPPSKIYIKLKALERISKEEITYRVKQKELDSQYEKLKREVNHGNDELHNEMKICKDASDEISTLLLPMLYKKIDQFEEDLDKYLQKHDIHIKKDIESLRKTHRFKKRSEMVNFTKEVLDSHKRNIRLNNDMVSSNEKMDPEEYEYFKERIINIFLIVADIRKRRLMEYNFKLSSTRNMELLDAEVNNDEIY